jgi:hypothetical protein
MGGDTGPALPSASTAATPESTFGILKSLLGTLESGLAGVKSKVENQQALVRATPSLWPIRGGWLTSLFGSRKDPFTGQPDYHTGLDISAERGTPVRATADGTVESAGNQGNYGNAIVIAHGFGIGTRFGHLSQFAVRPGAESQTWRSHWLRRRDRSSHQPASALRDSDQRSAHQPVATSHQTLSRRGSADSFDRKRLAFPCRIS